jgi:TPR repeat protein
MIDLAEGYRSNHSYSSDEKAIYWLKKSVKENNPVAMVKMFEIYYGLYYSDDKYVNYDEGKKLLLKAVELEYRDAYKQLSDNYLKGRVGFPKDKEKGVFWFKKYRAKLK